MADIFKQLDRRRPHRGRAGSGRKPALPLGEVQLAAMPIPELRIGQRQLRTVVDDRPGGGSRGKLGYMLDCETLLSVLRVGGNARSDDPGDEGDRGGTQKRDRTAST